MSIATANLPLHDSCTYWSVAVAVPLGRWRRHVRFYPLYGLRGRCQRHAVDRPKVIGNPMTSFFADPCPKVQTQILIALLPILTAVVRPAVVRPAVSSLEAYQTPAR